MFNKILVALDHSSQAAMVFQQALAIACSNQSHLLIFHALDWEKVENSPLTGIGTLADINVTGDWYKLRHESLQKDIDLTKSWLKTYSQQATAKNLASECECRIGNPSFWICDRAKEWGADLIILGRRGYTGLSEMLMGSVSNYVIHHAPCSVLVVQGNISPEIDESVTANEMNVSG